jgi:hypothetical protein
MNDQNQTPNPEQPANTSGSQPSDSTPGTPPTTYRSWREQRRAERWARREARWQLRMARPYSWMVGGVTLVLVGVALLLQSLGQSSLKNWWALFILIPAFWSYVAAAESIRNHGRLTRGGLGSLIWGSLLALLALVFLFNLDIGLFWPILLIVGGLGLLVTTLLPN